MRLSLALSTSNIFEDVEGLEAALEIGQPTNVRHVAHITYDRYRGFVGLLHDFDSSQDFPDLPSRTRVSHSRDRASFSSAAAGRMCVSRRLIVRHLTARLTAACILVLFGAVEARLHNA